MDSHILYTILLGEHSTLQVENPPPTSHLRCVRADSPSLDYLGFSGFLENHHNAAEDERSGDVFAFTGLLTFGDVTNRLYFVINFMIGTVAFEVTPGAKPKALEIKCLRGMY